jgi:hypothetical protein
MCYNAIMNKVLIIGGFAQLIGKTGTVIAEMLHEFAGGQISPVYQLGEYAFMNNKPLYFQAKHIMPLDDPKSCGLDRMHELGVMVADKQYLHQQHLAQLNAVIKSKRPQHGGYPSVDPKKKP